jgi:gliding motility-associated-like protein
MQPKTYGQVCTVVGQTPQTAFPVCGTDTFYQKNVPICATNDIPVNCMDGANYQNKNPFWYKFTCFQNGTLGFQILPNTLSDDYDWVLFDVTGVQDLNQVFANISLSIGSNWSSNPGSTGTSSNNTNANSCAGPTYPNQSKMPQLIQGHNYLLLVSHFTNSQDGYSLYFKGGTAVITDTTPPNLKGVDAFCDGIHISIYLNKKMKCNSLASDASDFTISPAAANIISATGNNCSSGFDMDTVILTLNTPLPVGNYTISVKNGTDGNTILDNCGNGIPVGSTVSATMFPLTFTPMDSITAVTKCSPDSIFLVFKKNMLCNSVAPDGSDFVITGPSSVTVSSASTGNCGTNVLGNSVTKTISLKLAAPIFTGGTYQIKLVNGSDGNTILNECGSATPANSTLNFTVKQSVSAAFTYTIHWGCRSDTVNFNHDGKNGVYLWQWNLDSNITSNQQNPSNIYTKFGNKKVSLNVSNGMCSDTSSQTIVLNNAPYKALFTAPQFVCPEDAAIFVDSSIGNIISWQWNFGNGDNSLLKVPAAEKYLPSTNPSQPIKQYTVTLIIEDSSKCYDTTTRIIKVPISCYIAVPSAFTPNNDGKNDYLHPLNAYKAINLVFNVYNRYGQLVFTTTDWTKKWDGYIDGQPQPGGSTYVWTLDYIEIDTGKKVSIKGTTVLIR